MHRTLSDRITSLAQGALVALAVSLALPVVAARAQAPAVPAAIRPVDAAELDASLWRERLAAIRDVGHTIESTGHAMSREAVEIAELAEESWARRLAESLGHDPRYRHRVMALLNARGGRLDRAFNRYLLRQAWATTPLPAFDTVADTLLRGGQPAPAGFQKLKDQGVKTVVNLRYEDNTEEPLVRSLGMQPVWLPMPDTCAPTRDQVQKLRQILADPSSGKIFIHCAGGIFRTSTMVSVYLIDHGSTADQALANARKHQFDDGWMDADEEEAFIKDYAAHPENWR